MKSDYFFFELENMPQAEPAKTGLARSVDQRPKQGYNALQFSI